MLGHVLVRYLSGFAQYEITATVRHFSHLKESFREDLLPLFYPEPVDADNFAGISAAIKAVHPEVIINCIGIIKQLPQAEEPLVAIAINALLPHQIAAVADPLGCRVIHISTDCVFSGKKGNYREGDPSDAEDLYGRTKFLGELTSAPGLTLRTSIIGHELKGGRHGLVEWFLAQTGRIRGFTRAIYSGFPTTELARIIHRQVLPASDLNGLYHLSAHPISKYELLRIVARQYGKEIEIEPYDDFVSDRSLDSSLFRGVTGYEPPSWVDLVARMHDDYQQNRRFYRSGQPG